MDFLQEVQRRWTESLDKRVVNFPLIESSYYVPLIIIAYLYFVLKCGPRFMKNRQPYSLKTFIKLYNIIQIIANAWLIHNYIDVGLFTNINKTIIICSSEFSLDYSYDYNAMRLCRYLWYYFMLKIVDFIETGLFVLRKKNNQVSGLHLYHHVATLVMAWLAVRYFAVSATTLNSLINCFIHMLMYTYYFLAALGPEIQKAVAPMKQWLTKIQMVQFILLSLYVSQNLWPDCKVVEHWIILIFTGNLMIYFYMFYKFYQKAYNKTKQKI